MRKKGEEKTLSLMVLWVSLSFSCMLLFLFHFAAHLTTATAGALIRVAPYSHLLIAPRTRSLDTGPPIIEVVFPGLDVIVYPLGDAHKGLFDVLAALCARLDVLEDAVPLGPLLGLLLCHLTLVVAVPVLPLGEVGLVADEDDDDVGLGDLAQVVEPVGHVLEGLFAAEVEDEEGAAGAAEVGARDGFVCFLAGGVPEGQLHVLLGPLVCGSRNTRGLGEAGGGCAAVRVRLGFRGRGRGREGVWGTDGDDAGAELDADCHVVVRGEAAFAEADGEGGFAAARVADTDEFSDVVPWWRRHGPLRSVASREVGGGGSMCV